jgi:methionyl aminopeptidase
VRTAIKIKTEDEIKLMREAGRILALTHEELKKIIKPGISTYDIDKLGEEVIRSYGCIPSFLNYNGYPASICVSVNDEVVHGIPSKDRILCEGDIVSLDAGVIYKGYHSDSARTYGVGTISKADEDLIRITKESFFEGLKQCKPGKHINDISKAVFGHVISRGYSAVVDLVGHGVGANLHEAPEIPNFPTRRRGAKLKPGMTIAVEPMVNIGDYAVEWLDDGWTVVTADGTRSAHYENTILITEGEPEILSKAPGIEL